MMSYKLYNINKLNKNINLFNFIELLFDWYILEIIKFFNLKKYPTKIPFFINNINKKIVYIYIYIYIYIKLHFNKNRLDGYKKIIEVIGF